jgi:hypothetical protein
MAKPRNAIILCDKRTGSTFLQSALGSHPQITSYSELFMIRSRARKTRGKLLYKSAGEIKKNKRGKKKFQRWPVNKYLTWVFSDDDSVTFKLIYDQCTHWNIMPVLSKRKVPIIHLIRRNFLKKAVSRATKNVFEVKKLGLPSEWYADEIAKDQRKLRTYRKILNKYPGPILELYYEDIIGGVSGKATNTKKLGAFNIQSDQITYVSDDVNEALYDFMQVKPFRLYSHTTRKNSPDVWEYIDNKQAVLSMLKQRKIKYKI